MFTTRSLINIIQLYTAAGAKTCHFYNHRPGHSSLSEFSLYHGYILDTRIKDNTI